MQCNVCHVIQKANNKNNPPTKIDQNFYCCKLAPISAYGTYDQPIHVPLRIKTKKLQKKNKHIHTYRFS